LRDEYRHYIADFELDQLVFVDESGCDKRVGFRRTGWSPLGTTPIQIYGSHREQRHQILPAYAQDGKVLARIFQGSTDAANRLLNSSSSTVAYGRSQNRCLLWITHPSIIWTELNSCALTQGSDCCTCRLTLQILTLLKSFLPSRKLTSRKPGQALR